MQPTRADELFAVNGISKGLLYGSRLAWLGKCPGYELKDEA
jgi:hypothetical protein